MEVLKNMTTSLFSPKEDEEWGFFVPLDEPINNRTQQSNTNQMNVNYHLTRCDRTKSENVPMAIYCMLNIVYAINYVMRLFDKS